MCQNLGNHHERPRRPSYPPPCSRRQHCLSETKLFDSTLSYHTSLVTSMVCGQKVFQQRINASYPDTVVISSDVAMAHSQRQTSERTKQTVARLREVQASASRGSQDVGSRNLDSVFHLMFGESSTYSEVQLVNHVQ